MVQVYYTLIKAGRKTIDDVPLKLRDAVQELLDADNLTDTADASAE